MHLKLNMFNRMPSFKIRVKRRKSESSIESDNSPSTPNNTPALSYITFHDANSMASLLGLFDNEFDEIKDCISPISCRSMGMDIIPAADKVFATISDEVACATSLNTPVDGHTSFFPIFVEDLKGRLEKLNNISLEGDVVEKEVIRTESPCTTTPNTPIDGYTSFFPIFVENLEERLAKLSRVIPNEESVELRLISGDNTHVCPAPPNTPVAGYTKFFPIFVEELKERLESHIINNPGAEDIEKDLMFGNGVHACPTPFNTPVLAQEAFVAVKECSSPIDTNITLRAASFDPISVKGLQNSLADVVISKKLRAIPESLEEGGHHVKVVGACNRMVKFALPAPPVREKRMDAITKSRMRLFT